MTNISAIVITRNEERNIERCLESIKWVPEIIVVDSGSSDKTVELARKFTNKVLITEWKGYSGAKTFALQQTSNNWIIWIDADEVVTQNLAREIKEAIKSNSTFSAFSVPRKAFFLGRWIRYGGWYPGHVIRIFRKDKCRFGNATVHESLIVTGKIGKLRSDLLHFTDDNLDHYFNKFNTYTTLASSNLFHQGKTVTVFGILVRPLFTFLKMYFFRLGFLDGVHGFILCFLSGVYVFTKYAKLWEKYNH